MRCFKTTPQFVTDYRSRNTPTAPEKRGTKYVIEYDNGKRYAYPHAPHSYWRVTRAWFVVDESGIVERIGGVWAEHPTPTGRRWLRQRALRLSLDKLSKVGFRMDAVVPFKDTEVPRLKKYLSVLTRNLTQDMVPELIERVKKGMEAVGEFELLERYGDCLDNPPS